VRDGEAHVRMCAASGTVKIVSFPTVGRAGYSAPMGALSPTLDATFFALSDPKRRGILERLGRGPATLSQLAGPSGLTLNGIKKHVGILEFAGLVETEKVGRVRECRLGPATTLGEAGEWIEAHRRAWEGRLDRFERFVEHAR
jgi:DNA-binding transcriptional ArsR family regulator